MPEFKRIAIDTSKDVFTVHGVDPLKLPRFRGVLLGLGDYGSVLTISWAAS